MVFIMAVATVEADMTASSVFVQIMGTALKKTAVQGHFDHFWSLRLV